MAMEGIIFANVHWFSKLQWMFRIPPDKKILDTYLVNNMG